jgi:hypothetical protein
MDNVKRSFISAITLVPLITYRSLDMCLYRIFNSIIDQSILMLFSMSEPGSSVGGGSVSLNVSRSP